MLLLNEVSIFSSSKNPSHRSVSSLFFSSLLVRAFSGRTSTFKQKPFTSIHEKLFSPLKHTLLSIVSILEELSAMWCTWGQTGTKITVTAFSSLLPICSAASINQVTSLTVSPTTFSLKCILYKLSGITGQSRMV